MPSVFRAELSTIQYFQNAFDWKLLRCYTLYALPTLNAYKVYGVYYAIFDHNSLDHWSYCHKDEAVLPFHSKLPHTIALKSIQPALITYIKRAVLTFKHTM